jgi:AcrR family transcriptional regulator
MPYLNRPTPDPEPIDCRILTAALDLFVNRGYHNVSVHDVQKQADVSIGSIYKHFGGKEGIAKALYLHLLNEMNEMVDTVIEQKHGAIERCNEIIRLLFEYTESHTEIIAYVLHAKHTEFISDEAPICSAEPFKKLRSMVQQGIDNGEINAYDHWIAASSVFGGAIRLIHLRLDGVIEQPLPELYEQLVDATWRGMGTASPALDARSAVNL